MWDCDTSLQDLWTDHGEDDGEEEQPERIRNDPLAEHRPTDGDEEAPAEWRPKRPNRIVYRKKARHYYRELTKDQSNVTSSSFHKDTKLLVAGLSNGSFFLHEMPDLL